jgi:hypothetical protein
VSTSTCSGATTSLPSRGRVRGLAGKRQFDVALVGFGPVTGVPYLYLRGDGLNLSIAIPDATDYLGKSEMRFSYQAGLIVVGSSLALAAGAGVFSGCTGFQGDLYVFNSAGVHQHTIAHGASVLLGNCHNRVRLRAQRLDAQLIRDGGLDACRDDRAAGR